MVTITTEVETTSVGNNNQSHNHNLLSHTGENYGSRYMLPHTDEQYSESYSQYTNTREPQAPVNYRPIPGHSYSIDPSKTNLFFMCLNVCGLRETLKFDYFLHHLYKYDIFHCVKPKQTAQILILLVIHLERWVLLYSYRIGKK